MFYKVLKEAKKNRELVNIILKEDDGFWCGYIEAVNKKVFKMKHYTEYGVSDGLIIEKIEDISCVELKDDYIKCLGFIIKHTTELHKEEEIKIKIGNDERWQERALKEIEGKKDQVIRVQISDDDSRTGVIEKVKDGYFKIKCFGRTGDDEGISIYACNAIESIRINSLNARKKLLLYNWKKGIKR